MIPIAKPFIGREEEKAVVSVLKSGMLAQGPNVEELETRFAKFCGTKYAIAVNSGTAALHTALYSLGVKSNDEVITTPFTFVATANCILMQNAKPVFADVKEDTFNIDPESIKEKITSKTKAIIPVDLYGQIYDYKNLKKIAEDNNILILEDAAQAIEAESDGKRAGTFGDISTFSFYATKNLMSGEGGMITTDNEDYVELCKRFRHHGQSKKTGYEYYDLGYNYRMTDLHASIALAQLDKLDFLTKRRIENANLLTEGLKNLPWITTPYILKNNKHVFHQYTIKCDNIKIKRNELLQYLKNKGIGAGVYYPQPLHLYPHFRKLGYKEGDFLISEKLSKQVISLPVHPQVTKEEIDYIISKIREFTKNE